MTGDSKYGTVLYQCYREHACLPKGWTCSDGDSDCDHEHVYLDDEDNVCWLSEGDAGRENCDPSRDSCAKGSKGFLCAACEEGYAFSSHFRKW